MLINSGNSPVALITGARKGIGRALSEHLLEQGYYVVGCSRTRAEWTAQHFTHFEIDISNEKQIQQLFRHISENIGRLDVAINNAAVASINHVLLTPATSIESILNSNITGTLLVCREAARLMRSRNFGRIVNFTSAVVRLRLPGSAVYLASKSAVETLSQVLAKELAEFGITVNVIGPGPTDTDMLRGISQEKIALTLDKFSIKRLTTMQDITNVLDFFLHPRSTAVTAQVLYLNGIPNQ